MVRYSFSRVGVTCIGLLFMIGLAPSAVAQVTNNDPYPVANDPPTQSSETQSLPGAGWAQWHRMIARQQALAIWRYGQRWQGAPVTGVGISDGTAVTPTAGDVVSGGDWSLWKEAGPALMRDDSAALRSKGYTLSTTLGLDRQLSENAVLGLYLGHAYTNAKTLYNNGRERTHNYSAGLFLSHRLAPWLTLDAQGGYVHQRQKLKRQVIGGTQGGRRSSNGYQLSAALNATHWVDQRTMLSARLGVIATRDRWGGYTENGALGPVAIAARTEALVQGVAEVGTSWWLEPFMPRIGIAYNRDLYRRGVAGSSDRDDFSLNAGLTWFGSGEAEGLTLDFNGSVVLGRAQQRHWMLGAALKWAW